MFFPYINLTKVNVATVNQTLVQLQSNSAAINQG
jgi:hypothetical protein